MSDQRPLPYVTPAPASALTFPLSFDMPTAATQQLGRTNYLLWACSAFRGAPGLLARGSAPFDSVRLDPQRSSPHAVIAIDPYGGGGDPQILTPGAVARFARPVDSVRVWNPLDKLQLSQDPTAWYGAVSLIAGTDLRESEPRNAYPGVLARAAMHQVLAASFGDFNLYLPPPGAARAMRISVICTKNTPPAYDPMAAPADLAITLTGRVYIQGGLTTDALSAANRAYALNSQQHSYYTGFNTAGAFQGSVFWPAAHEDFSVTFDQLRNVVERVFTAPGLTAGLWLTGSIAGTGMDSVYFVTEYL